MSSNAILGLRVLAAVLALTIVGAVQAATPAAPTGLIVGTGTSTSLNLSWLDKSADETGFKIERSLDQQKYDLVATVGANVTSYTDTGLKPALLYMYRVRATNASGDSAPCDWQYAPTLSALTTTPVMGADTKLVVNSSTALTLSWKNPFDAVTGFRIERALADVFPATWTEIAQLPGTATSYQNTGLTAGTSYMYRMRGTNGTIFSAYVGFPRGQTFDPAVAAPTNLAAVSVSTSRFNLTWTDNATNEQYFTLERSWDGVNFTGIDYPAANATSFVFDGVHHGVTYYFRLQAIGSTRTSSAYSNTVAVTAKPFSTLVAAPSNVVANRVGTVNTVTWNDNSTNETGFRVEGSQDGMRFNEVIIVPANTTTLQAPYSGYYRIQAMGASGDSRYSPVAQVNWSSGPLAVPTGLTATAASATQINLAWTDGGVATTFRVERSIDNITFAPIARTFVKTWQDQNLVPGSKYYYRVQATLNNLPSAYTAAVSTTTQSITVAPGVPTTLTVAGVSRTQINLTWKEGTGYETGFRIQRSTDNVNFVDVKTVGMNVTCYSDIVPAAGTYWYRVNALNGIGASAFTASLSGATLAADPVVAISTRIVGGLNELVVTGTAANDTITVSQSGVTISIAANGLPAVQRVGPFARIQVFGKNGDDSLTTDVSVAVPTELYADNGADTLVARGSAKAILMAIGGGPDTLTGNGINTSFWGDEVGFDTINASSAERAAQRVHRISTFYQPFTTNPASVDYVTKNPGQRIRESSFLFTGQRIINASLWGNMACMFDVNQGSVQDCGFTAHFQSLGDSVPDQIQELAADMGDGTYVVKHGYADVASYMRMDDDFGTSTSKVGRNGSIWGLVFEKAYYGYNTGLNCTGAGYTVKFDSVTAEEAFSRIGAALKNNYLVSSLTKGEQVLNAPLVNQDHAYSFVGVFRDRAGQPRFIMRNPYGFNFTTTDNNLGLATLTFDQIRLNCGIAGISEYVGMADVQADPGNLTPSVVLDAPIDGLAVVVPAAVTVSASAFDADGSIAKVEFFRNGALAGTDTVAPYSIPVTLTTTGAHSFTARATDNRGAVATSAPVTVNAFARPAITAHPVNKTVQLGQTALFTITASGSPTLTYQWQKNGVNIAGATLWYYFTPATVITDNNATFRCVVRNAYGTAISNSAILTVNRAPVITSGASASPNPSTVGTSVSLTVAANDADGNPLTYSWTFGDGTSATGAATSHVYSTSGTFTASVTVTDGKGGSATSSVTVTVNAAAATTGVSTQAEPEIQMFAPEPEVLVPEQQAPTTTEPTVTAPAVGAPTLSSSSARFSAKMNLQKMNADSVSIDATANVGDTKVGSGTEVAIEIGGQRFTATLDAKLRAKNSTATWQVTFGKKGQPAGEIALKVKVKKVSFSQAFAGMAGSSNQTLNASVPVRLEVAGKSVAFSADSTIQLTSKSGKASGAGSAP
jgi:hypothetical protein